MQINNDYYSDLTVERPDPEDAGALTTLDIEVVLGPYRFIDEDGNVLDDPDRGMVGVLLTDAAVEVIFPVDVQIDSQNIGGPSAGLMFLM